ncbi:hypothetical protein Tco_0615017 [Tanacetum coccineum]
MIHWQAQSEAFKQENVLAERLHGLDPSMERKGDVEFVLDALDLGFYWWEVLTGNEAPCHQGQPRVERKSLSLPMSSAPIGFCLTETCKGCKAKELLGCCKQHEILEWKIELESTWILSLIFLRLRLPQELSSVHDTFHVSYLKKCLADANLHVPFNEIKVYKILCFVEGLLEIMNREIKKVKT